MLHLNPLHAARIHTTHCTLPAYIRLTAYCLHTSHCTLHTACIHLTARCILPAYISLHAACIRLTARCILPAYISLHAARIRLTVLLPLTAHCVHLRNHRSEGGAPLQGPEWRGTSHSQADQRAHGDHLDDRRWGCAVPDYHNDRQPAQVALAALGCILHFLAYRTAHCSPLSAPCTTHRSLHVCTLHLHITFAHCSPLPALLTALAHCTCTLLSAPCTTHCSLHTARRH